MPDTYISDIQKKEIVDWFVKSWTDQTFPVELKIKNYLDARKFRVFWLENAGLSLQDAIDFYNLKQESETKQG
jgi:hypothetical protein